MLAFLIFVFFPRNMETVIWNYYMEFGNRSVLKGLITPRGCGFILSENLAMEDFLSSFSSANIFCCECN